MLVTPKQPDIPPMPKRLGCEHKWVFQRSDFQRDKRSQYKDFFKRIDTYYCEKCLEVREVVAREEDMFSGKPYWFEG